MWPQAQFHQWLCFRQACWSKSVLLLVRTHGFTRGGTPHAVRFVVQEAGFDKRFLNLPYPCRLEADPSVPAGSTDAAPALMGSRLAHRMSSFLLTGNQRQDRDKQRRQGHGHGPPNPLLADGIKLFHVSKIKAEYRPRTRCYRSASPAARSAAAHLAPTAKYFGRGQSQPAMIQAGD